MFNSLTPVLKRCPKCLYHKALDEFSIAPSRSDGRHGYCKSCRRTYAAEWLNAEPSRRTKMNEQTGQRHREEREAVDERYVKYLVSKRCDDGLKSADIPDGLVKVEQELLLAKRKLWKEKSCDSRQQKTGSFKSRKV